ncbi:MAG: signal peptidase II [Firmicutes bacterium]|nr:signal peptidase II [Bacillota bacterium]MDD4263505.1 signal peptidase II [Bacillota bacterium]MDD4693744.1 signal peptidase II [Bacillota bacterium]
MVTLIVAIVWLFLDQIIKFILPKVMSWYETLEVIPGILNISLVKNDGAAFGILAGKTWFLIPIAIIFVIYLFLQREKISKIPFAKWGAPIAAAGTLGNAIDRIFRGYVIDFIDVPFFSVFNIADIGITVGILLIAVGLYLHERDQENDTSNNPGK